MPKPTLTFFCELETPVLEKLFSDKELLKKLKLLGANLSLGLLDLSKKRADVVKKLTKAGIPVTAWILLPKEKGYWTSLANISETVEQYKLFKEWVKVNHLEFAAIGLDIEPKLETVQALGNNAVNELPVLLKNLVNNPNFEEQLHTAKVLIAQMRSEGFAVETYQFPTVVDERAAHSTVISKALGIPPLAADREVLMLYSSFFPSHEDSILWSYAKEAKAVGVGSTGGGVELEGMLALKIMRWMELKRDLLLASQNAEHVYIFSLEGCVANNYMDRLCTLDWELEVIPPTRSAFGITLARKTGQGLLWVLSHPVETFAIVLGWSLLFRRKKQ